MFAWVPPDEMKMDEATNYCEKRSEGIGILEASNYCYKRSECSCHSCLTTIYIAPFRSNLHLACEKGDLRWVEKFIRRNRKLCLKENCSGKTALHISVENAKVDVINAILRYCPEYVKEVTDKTRETCLHVAMKNNQIDVVLHLLKWVTGERPDFLHVLDFKDYKRKTAVQFSKQFRGSFMALQTKDSLEDIR